MAKLSSASIRLVQKMNRKNKNGEFPIYIVVCFKGRLEKSTGVSCLSKYWDSKREVIKVGCPNAAVLNKMLSDIKNRVIERRNEFEYNERVYTPSMLLEDARMDYNGKSNVFIDVMDRLMNERRLKLKTRKRYTYAYKKICDYIGRKDFIIDELNLGFIKDFMRSLNVGDGTKRDICSCIASVWNYGISRKLVDGSDYPFDEFKFTTRYKNGERDYFLDKSHIRKLMDYWLDLVIVRNGKRWTYKDDAFDSLMKRNSKEFGILWFLLMYKFNGSAPIEVAMLRNENCRRISINNEDYWAIDFQRQKTKTDVHVRWKRDLFCIIGLEHFMGRSKNGMVYPIAINVGDEEKMNRDSWKCSEKAIKWVREAFKEINEATIRKNVDDGCNEPLVECEKVVMYTARHSFACHYLFTPNASVSGLASLMARSPNTIATYIHQLTKDEDIAREVENMVI